MGNVGQGPPDFERSVIPILTGEGVDYAHHITTSPSELSDLPTAL